MENKRTTIVFVGILVTSLLAAMIPLASAQTVTVSIGSGSAREGETAIVPLMISDVTDMAAAVVNLTFNESVVDVTAVSDSQFDQPPLLNKRGPGWVLLEAGQFMTGLDGDILMCNVTLEAVGDEGQTSALNLTDIVLENMSMVPIAVDVVSNGTFSILDETAPEITDKSADPYYIANDGVMESQLNVTVIDHETAVDTVQIDLTPIGFGVEHMIPLVGNEVWGLAVTSAVEGIHHLYINATDIHGNSNTSEYVELVVIQPPMVTIADGTAMPGGTTTVELMINGIPVNASVGSAVVNLTFNESVTNVTAVSGGDFNIKPDLNTRGPGWVLLQAGQFTTGLSGDKKMCDVTLKAVGGIGETSPLNLTDVALEDMAQLSMPCGVHNGTFTSGELNPPVVTDASANPPVIPDDTDDDPRWGETSVLNVTVTDVSNIVSVTIDLSAVGGSAVQPMANIVGDIWSVGTNATAGTAPGTYDLTVNATDEYGNSNVTVSIRLRVQKNGDVQPYDGDGTVDFMHDGLYLVRHTLNVPGYADIRENIADVTGEGTVDFMHDGLYLVRHTLNVPGYGTLK
jgi:hypothetical protein